jgi:hypothetical protein
MSDALILDHIAATGGNIYEMSEHLSPDDIARATFIISVLTKAGIDIYS